MSVKLQKKVLFSTVGIIVSLGLFLAGYTLGQKKPLISKLSFTETENWKTYCNDVYGFCLEYPSSWKFKEQDFRVVAKEKNYPANVFRYRILFDNSEGHVHIDIWDNPDNLTLEKWFDWHYKDFLTLPITTPALNTKALVTPAILVIDKQAQGVPTTIDTIFQKDNHVFKVSLGAWTSADVLDYMHLLLSLKF